MQFSELVRLFLFFFLPVMLASMVTYGLVCFFSFVLKVKIAKGVYESNPMSILLLATGTAVISLLYVMRWEKQTGQPFLYPLQPNLLTPVEALIFTIAWGFGGSFGAMLVGRWIQPLKKKKNN